MGHPLRRALEEAVSGAAQKPADTEAISTLCRCARTARKDGIMPEHVVMAIHDIWQLRQPSLARKGVTGRDLHRVIRTVLDAYFRAD